VVDRNGRGVRGGRRQDCDQDERLGGQAPHEARDHGRIIPACRRGGKRTRPWLFTVARNLFASWCRRRALDEGRLFGLVLSRPGPAPRESPFEAAARTETERRLEAALAGLAPRDREVLLLVAGEDLSPAEAAAVLDLVPEALRKRLQRARERPALAMQEAPDLLLEKAR
jgi:RNA polymerase sigma factor (sigma-70 family)